MKNYFKKTDLTDDQILFVKQRAMDISFRLLMQGHTFYHYGNQFHFLWSGPRLEDPRLAPGCGLADFDSVENVLSALHFRRWLNIAEEAYWRVIAEDIRDLAHKYSLEIPIDPVVDSEVQNTRSHHWKRVLVHNYFWDRFHYYKHDYDQIKGN